MAGSGCVSICMSKDHDHPKLPLLSSVVSWGGGGYLRPSLSLDSGWVRAYGNFLLTGMQNAVVGLGVAGVGTASSL